MFLLCEYLAYKEIFRRVEGASHGTHTICTKKMATDNGNAKITGAQAQTYIIVSHKE